MSNEKNNNSSKKRIRGIILVLIAFLLWTGLTGYNQWIDIKEKKLMLAELVQEEQKVIVTKKELEKKVYLLQDDDYIADIARKNYFLSKPDELIFITSEE